MALMGLETGTNLSQMDNAVHFIAVVAAFAFGAVLADLNNKRRHRRRNHNWR